MKEIGRLIHTGPDDDETVLLTATEEELNTLRLLQAAVQGKTFNPAVMPYREPLRSELSKAFQAIREWVFIQDTVNRLRDQIQQLDQVMGRPHDGS